MKVVRFTPEEFQEKRELWNNAVQGSMDANIFLTWEWLSNWWKHFGDRRGFLLTVVIDGGKIVAAAPLMTSNSPFGLEKIEFIGTPHSDYSSFLLTEKNERHVEMILDYVNRTEPNWQIMQLNRIPAHFDTARILRSNFTRPMMFEEKTLSPCPYVPLPDRIEDYLRTIRPHLLKEIGRRERRLRQDYKADFKVCSDLETVDDAMKAFFALHLKRWRSKRRVSSVLLRKEVRDFHLDVARSFARKGWLALVFLSLNDVPVAGHYYFRYANKMYCYLSGFDPRFSRYGVMGILELHLIEQSIRAGLEEYDFMRGGEPYKNQWNTTTRMNIGIRAVRKGTIVAAYERIIRSIRDLVWLF